LALGHAIAFVDQHLREATGDFGGDLDFSGFKSAVAHADAFGESVMLGFPVTEPACRHQQDHQRNNEIMGYTVVLRHANILSHRAL
jgi:hypothetical protein